MSLSFGKFLTLNVDLASNRVRIIFDSMLVGPGLCTCMLYSNTFCSLPPIASDLMSFYRNSTMDSVLFIYRTEVWAVRRGVQTGVNMYDCNARPYKTGVLL